MANDGHQIAVAARLRPENTKAVLAVVEGDPLHKAGEYFLSRWFKNGLHTVWKPRVNSSGRDALHVLPGDSWSHTPVSFKLGLTRSASPVTRYRRTVFRQASSCCKAAVWETRSPKISLASSTPRN